MDVSTNGILPYTHSCFICGEENPRGLRLRCHLEDCGVVIRYTPQEEDCGWSKFVHGGIATALLDEVMTWAAILSTHRACVAAEINVRLIKPIIAGRELHIIGNTKQAKSRLVLVKGAILNEKNDLVFSSEGKYIPMDKKEALRCAQDFVESPDTIAITDIFEDLPSSTQ